MRGRHAIWVDHMSGGNGYADRGWVMVEAGLRWEKKAEWRTKSEAEIGLAVMGLKLGQPSECETLGMNVIRWNVEEL